MRHSNPSGHALQVLHRAALHLGDDGMHPPVLARFMVGRCRLTQ